MAPRHLWELRAGQEVVGCWEEEQADGCGCAYTYTDTDTQWLVEAE